MAAAALLMAGATWSPTAAVHAQPPPPKAASGGWPTYHHDNARSGRDPLAPSFAGASAPLAKWSANLDGKVYAEPLALNGLTFVATENDTVYALDESDGAVRWQTHLGSPASVSQVGGGCGNIDPIGITGTPVLDLNAGLLYAVGLVHSPFQYEMWTLRLSDGSLAGTRVINPNGLNPAFQQERGALALSGGTVYVPFGGYAGDCTPYHPWVVGVPTAGGALLTYQPQTGSQEGAGIWAPSGEAVDASGDLYVETGNGFASPSSPCPTSSSQWDHGDGVIKLSPTLGQLGFFAPANWCSLNASDQDLGSTAPLLLPDGTVFASGKSGQGWLLNPDGTNPLGGFGGQEFQAHIDSCRTSDSVFGGFAYSAPLLYVPCDGVGLVALNVDTAAHSFSVAWSAGGFSPGPPIVAGGLVWSASRGGGRLSGFDRATGRLQVQVALGSASRFVTPTSDNGWILVPTDAGVQAFLFAASPSLSSGYANLGGTLSSGPDAASWGSGRLDAFVQGTDGAAWHRWRASASSGWSAWESLGGRLQTGSGPAAVSWGPGRVDLFVRGVDDRLWHRWYDAGGWSAWESLGGILTSDPDAASWSGGRLDVFVRGTDNGLWHRWYDGGRWSGWEPLGGSLSSSPGAASWGPGRADVFARGSSNQLVHRWWSGAWGAETLPAGLLSGPDVAAPAPGRLSVFGLDNGGAVSGTGFDGARWTPWHAVGGTGSADPGATTSSPGLFDLFVRGTDNSLYYASGR